MLAIYGIILGSCGTALHNTIRTNATDKRANVFSEINDQGDPSQGFADVVVRASIKTNDETNSLIESKGIYNGENEYTFSLKIDGQNIIWRVMGERESIDHGDEKDINHQEYGKGIRYVLDKKIRVAEGNHRVVFTIPGKNYLTKQAAINIKAEEKYILEFKPKYKSLCVTTHIKRRHPKPSYSCDRGKITFSAGIKDFEISLNGNKIKDS
jgi:hypothetical protein